MKLVVASDSNGTSNYVTAAETFGKLIADALGFDTLVNSSVSGQTAAGILSSIDSLILSHAPDSCIVMVGTNESDAAHTYVSDQDAVTAAYLTSMGDIIEQVDDADIPLALFSPPMSRGVQQNVRLAHLSSGVKSLALKRNVGYFPLNENMAQQATIMSGDDFIQYWTSPTSTDMYHFGAAWHAWVKATYCRTQLVQHRAIGVVMDCALDTNFGNVSEKTVKAQIKKAAIIAPPYAVTKMRLTLKGHADEPMQISSIYIGHRGGSDAWDSPALTQVKYAGVGAFTVPQNGTLVMDWTNFAWDRTSDLIVSFYCNGDASHDKLAAKSDSNGVTHYKAGDEAATANATGFSSYSNYLSLVSKIESDGF